MTAVIRIEKLGKRYQIAPCDGQAGYRTLRESLAQVMFAPFRRVRFSSPREPATDFWALKDVSFEVQRGEIVGIIGRNGAGKSTLLKILSRITKPTTGRVRIDGRIGSLLEVGTGFHPELTGRENIYLNGSILGMNKKEIDRRFDEIVAFAEIARFLETPVKRYSSGMYVRLAFAVAAHLEPEILVVDEVLAVGDSQFQKRCLDKMNAVSWSGRTILFVSHNMPAVAHLCSTGVLLSGGRVAAVGPINGIIDEYQKRERVTGESVIDLALHPNRRGGKEPRLMRLRLFSNGEPAATVRMGGPLELVIEYNCGQTPLDLKLGITVADQRGVRVVNFTPSWQAPDLSRNYRSCGALKCAVPHVSLVEGYYSVHVYYDDGVESQSVENACELQVLAADVFNTGRPPEARHGLVFMDASWSLVG